MDLDDIPVGFDGLLPLARLADRFQLGMKNAAEPAAQ